MPSHVQHIPAELDHKLSGDVRELAHRRSSLEMRILFAQINDGRAPLASAYNTCVAIPRVVAVVIKYGRARPAIANIAIILIEDHIDVLGIILVHDDARVVVQNVLMAGNEAPHVLAVLAIIRPDDDNVRTENRIVSAKIHLKPIGLVKEVVVSPAQTNTQNERWPLAAGSARLIALLIGACCMLHAHAFWYML